MKSRLKSEKENSRDHTPSPVVFIDAASNTANESATPQSIATIRGHDLKFDPKDPKQGVFFVPETGSGSVRVNFHSNIKTTEIYFLIPPV